MDEQDIQDEKLLHRKMTHSMIGYKFDVIHQPGSDFGGSLIWKSVPPSRLLAEPSWTFSNPSWLTLFVLCGQCAFVSNQGDAISRRSFSPCSGLEFGAEIPSNLPICSVLTSIALAITNQLTP